VTGDDRGPRPSWLDSPYRDGPAFFRVSVGRAVHVASRVSVRADLVENDAVEATRVTGLCGAQGPPVGKVAWEEGFVRGSLCQQCLRFAGPWAGEIKSSVRPGGVGERVAVVQGRGVALPEGVRSVAHPSRWAPPWLVNERMMPPAKARAGGWLPVEVRGELLVAVYRAFLDERLRREPEFLDELLLARGVACYCPADAPCHRDVIVEALTKRWSQIQHEEEVDA